LSGYLFGEESEIGTEMSSLCARFGEGACAAAAAGPILADPGRGPPSASSTPRTSKDCRLLGLASLPLPRTCMAPVMAPAKSIETLSAKGNQVSPGIYIPERWT